MQDGQRIGGMGGVSCGYLSRLPKRSSWVPRDLIEHLKTAFYSEKNENIKAAVRKDIEKVQAVEPKVQQAPKQYSQTSS